MLWLHMFYRIRIDKWPFPAAKRRRVTEELFCTIIGFMSNNMNISPPISLHSILEISSVTRYYFNFEISSSRTSKFDLSSNLRFLLRKLRQLKVIFKSKSLVLVFLEFSKPLLRPCQYNWVYSSRSACLFRVNWAQT